MTRTQARLVRVVIMMLTTSMAGMVGVEVFARPAAAATLNVTNCANSGAGSLRNAVVGAASGDTITFALSPACSLITLTGGQIDINKNLTITGPGANVVAVSGGDTSRVFLIDFNTTVAISGLTIEHGKANTVDSQGGGGILNYANLTLTNDTVSNNRGGGRNGGGIANVAAAGLNIIDSTLSNNQATGGVGGAIAGDGFAVVTNSTLSGNSATNGGAIATFGSNPPAAPGEAFLTNSTLSGNSVPSGGSGTDIWTNAAFTIPTATIVANGGAGGDCGGSSPVTDNGHNIGDDATCGFSGTSVGSSSTLDGSLGALSANGGPTNTIALLAGSPAIDQIPATACPYPAGMSCPTTDQRGVMRSFPFDIGAYDTDDATPMQPRPVAAVPFGNRAAKVIWNAPASAGTSPITRYSVTPYLGTIAQPTRTFNSTATNELVTGLQNGKAYRFTITAGNTVGDSAPSPKTIAITVGAPGQPGKPTVTRVASGSLKVMFAAPNDDGAPITLYAASCASSNSGSERTKTGHTRPITVTGLTPGKTYTCTVNATNNRGTGPSSKPSRAATA